MSMSRPSEASSSVSRSAVTDASVSRSSRVRADGTRRPRVRDGADHRVAQEQQVRVTDPDNPEIDRTPKEILKPHQSQRNVIRKGVVAVAGDRRVPAAEGGSVSMRSSRSEEKSISQAEGGGSSSSSEHVSSSTPDDYTTEMFDESTSDSHSTMERSSAGLGRRQSQISSSDGVSINADQGGDRQVKGAAGEKSAAAAEPKSKLTPEPRLCIMDAYLGRRAPPKEWTPENLRQWRAEEVVITLTETPLMFLFSKADEAVANIPGPEADAVRRRNQRYEEFVKADKHQAGGRYLDRGVTTLNDPSFSAKADAVPPATANAGMVQVNPYDLYDALVKANEEEIDAADENVVRGGEGDGEQDEEAAANRDADDEADDVDEAEEGQAPGSPGAGPRGKKGAAWLQSPSLLETVMIVERCVVMNNYEELQLAYRGISMEPVTDHIPPSVETQKATSPAQDGRRRRDYSNILQSDERDDEARKREEARAKEQEGEKLAATAARAKMRTLWSFGSEATRGKNVTCLAWNRKNTDLLAAGYGEYGVPGTSNEGSAAGYGGLVNCWSVKNPFTPERTIQIESDAGVSALHFSRQHPSLLAVGNTDGTLALYDVRAHGNTPALKTTVSTGQHTGTIWEVRWVDKGQERGETLISVSADGHVMEWSIKKGLERTADLMKLKRAPASEGHGLMQQSKGAVPKEALLARQSGGMCFDINPIEPITYVVGTEDGTIHKCSKSQNENYIMSYKPHGEPVYRVRWSPYCPEYFLTASADWTSRLYHINKTDPVAVYDSLEQDAVQDLCWSNTNASIFATATAQGRVDVWDIAVPNQRTASLDLKRPLNCLLFAEQEASVVVCGDVSGEIAVIKLQGEEFERGGRSDREQEERLREMINRVSIA